MSTLAWAFLIVGILGWFSWWVVKDHEVELASDKHRLEGELRAAKEDAGELAAQVAALESDRDRNVIERSLRRLIESQVETIASLSRSAS